MSPAQGLFVMEGKTAGEGPSEQQDDSDSAFVEVDPTGRYGRYREVLGKGAFKTVYKAFDELEGIEVAWNQVKVADLLRNSDDLERLYSEVHLLKTLKHKNIIKFYNSWVDSKQGNINFITEIFTSGTLRQYRKKHKHVDIRALKNWSRQILQGLHYLHSHDPPVIHRDLKCDNIFVNGNQGEVKIGDLGLAAILRHAHSAHSVIGTPEFMAPELYEEDYNELVDIYAFGMCLLELVTLEYPYMECTNAAQIYKKVTAGIKPASLERVSHREVRRFIEKCIANVSERLPAKDLLVDPFLQADTEDESIAHSSEPRLNRSDDSGHQLGNASGHLNDNGDSPSATRDFTVQGQMKDTNTMFLKLRIGDSTGNLCNIHFPFDIEVDTSFSVASEMVAELDLTDHDVTVIAAMIDAEIQSHVPEWVPGETLNENRANVETTSDNFHSRMKDETSEPPVGCDHPSGGLVLEWLPSGRKYWSDSPKGASGGSPARHRNSSLSKVFPHGNAESLVEVCEGETSTSNIDEEENLSNDIPSSSQPNGMAAFDDRSKYNMNNDDPSVSSEVPSASTCNMVNGENGEFSSSQTKISMLLFNTESNPTTSDAGECSEVRSLNSHEMANEDKEAPLIDSESSDNEARLSVDQHDDNSTHLLDYGKMSTESEQEDIKILVGKLENLLLDQQKEVEELKMKHKLAVADVLKKLPPEIYGVTLNMRGLGTLGFNVHGEGGANARHSNDSAFLSPGEALPSHVHESPSYDIAGESSSRTAVEDLDASKADTDCLGGSTTSLEKEKREHTRGSRVGGLIFRDRSHMSRVDSKRLDVGIAVILRDLSKIKSQTDVAVPKVDKD